MRSYFITFSTYGSRLHGDERGSVDTAHNQYESERLPPHGMRKSFERSRLLNPPVVLDEFQRKLVETAISDVCRHRSWELAAINVRSNHVHVLCSGDATPERMMNDFKSWSTRRLREQGVVGAETRLWTRHGSTRYVWSEADRRRVWEYVVNGQDGERFPG